MSLVDGLLANMIPVRKSASGDHSRQAAFTSLRTTTIVTTSVQAQREDVVLPKLTKIEQQTLLEQLKVLGRNPANSGAIFARDVRICLEIAFPSSH